MLYSMPRSGTPAQTFFHGRVFPTTTTAPSPTGRFPNFTNLSQTSGSARGGRDRNCGQLMSRCYWLSPSNLITECISHRVVGNEERLRSPICMYRTASEKGIKHRIRSNAFCLDIPKLTVRSSLILSYHVSSLKVHSIGNQLGENP